MLENFDDAFGGEYLNKEGVFQFEVIEATLKESSKGDPMVEVTLKCDEGQTKDYFVLTDKAKWKYKNFIALCFGYTSKEALIADGFQKDLDTVHNELIGKYIKDVKVENDDGVFETRQEERVSYKINKYVVM